MSGCGSAVHARAGGAGGALTTSPAGSSSPRASSSGGHSARSEGAGTRSTEGGSDRSSELQSLIALGRPIYCAGPHGDEVALTFDDGPGPFTRLVLNKLRVHRVPATFFDVARNIPLGRAEIRSERAQGAVGDHTVTHPLLTTLSSGEAEAQIVQAQAALARASEAPVQLFRPPYGGRNATVDAIVRAHGLLEVLWTVDSADSLGANYAQIERNVIAGLHPGSIILMHENHGQTVRALLGIFAALSKRHLRAVSLPRLLGDDPPSTALLQAGGGACGVRGRALAGS